MTTEQLKTIYSDIIDLANNGQYMQIVAKYFDPNITKVDNGKSLTGNDAWKEEDNFYNGGKVTNIKTRNIEVAYGENIVMSKWFIAFEHPEWGNISQEQMVLTKFNDEGKIIYEEYMYPSAQVSA